MKVAAIRVASKESRKEIKGTGQILGHHVHPELSNRLNYRTCPFAILSLCDLVANRGETNNSHMACI